MLLPVASVAAQSRGGFIMITQLFTWFNAGLRLADEVVAWEAHRQGISKADAWAGVAAAGQMQGDQAMELLADVFDPMGWRAASVAFQQAA